MKDVTLEANNKLRNLYTDPTDPFTVWNSATDIPKTVAMRKLPPETLQAKQK
jgi:hypothetical protein